MRTLLLSILLLGTSAASHAQIVSTFDDLTLSKPDTFYVNYTSPGNDVGFDDGMVHFPCVYDTAYGGLWDYGFAYTNMTDSSTDSYTNLYSAITAAGFDTSANYAAVSNFNPIPLKVLNPGGNNYTPTGFYITNNTYAYKSMLYGNDYPAKKFGGDSGNDPDWFKVTIRGYNGNQPSSDSVDFYLADYRFTNNDSDYIVKDWKWVNLLPLGNVDSLEFTLSSSDTAGGFGMNTPAYYCIDNFTAIILEGVPNPQTFVAKVYPNPTTNQLFIDVTANSVQEATIYDMAGRTVGNYTVSGSQLAINTASLPAGNYILKLEGNNKTANVRFVKQ